MVALREIMERVAFPTIVSPFDTPVSNPALAQCYSIPYGAFGFISHVLTLYTIYCSAIGKKWWMPWDDVKPPPQPGWIRRIFTWLIYPYRAMASCINFAVTVAMSIYTIYGCRDAYRLLAVWKLLQSFFDGASEGMFLYHSDKWGWPKMVFFGVQFFLFFLPGVIVGIIGIKDLAEQYWSSSATLHTVTWVFVGVFSGAVAVVILCVTHKTLPPSKETKDVNQNRISVATTTDSDMKQTGEGSMIKGPDAGNPGHGGAVAGLIKGWKFLESGLDGPSVFNVFFKIFFRVLGLSLILAYVLGTAYADWMVGIAADNIVGVPHESVLGGVYFAAKHVIMVVMLFF
ncbi:hypothetical protein FIBSPDRAFT_379571 [Athelia psychrophila]|uniref:Uncharacterized protein n=1 Tax=Athelia psychrophila TaxID=1759441 RepID=A0A166P409_9AGAM|nr:hypothetical protein FIBSPDRAFT_379571 [Fibularhizoctonia sp. CBS 109695]